MQILPLNPQGKAARALLAQADALSGGSHTDGRPPLDSASDLSRPGVLFRGLWLSEWLAACAAVRPVQDGWERYGEIQRVFVRREFRRRGLCKALMQHLEGQLRQRGVPLARLEAGVHQAEALALYDSLGYVRCGPFGDHGHHPLSVFMEKRLDG